MTHYRSTLRAATKDLLQADPLFAAANVVLSSAQVSDNSIPCFSVSTPGEDRRDLNRRQFQAEIDLVIAASVKGDADTIEDLLDDYSDKIEAIILGGLKEHTGMQSVLLRRTELKTGPETKNVIGSVMKLFVVTGYISG